MTTTTAAVIISDALKELQVIGEGETPSATMLSDGLRMLNRLLETFSTDGEFAYAEASESIALTGQQSITLGPSGSVTTKRPIKIESAYVDRGGISYPVSVLDGEQYDALTYKAQAGANTAAIYYDATYPDGTLYLYPVSTGCTLHLSVMQSVKQFASTSDQIDMPEGYEDAIILALAVRMGPGYGKKVSEDTKQAARRAMGAIKRVNRDVPMMDLPAAVAGGSGTSFGDFIGG